jgi:hypothetical protein
VYNKPGKGISIMPSSAKTRSKRPFERHTKVDDFNLGDLVLKWDARNEDKGKHKNFDHLWLGPFKIAAYHGSNAYIL